MHSRLFQIVLVLFHLLLSLPTPHHLEKTCTHAFSDMLESNDKIFNIYKNDVLTKMML